MRLQRLHLLAEQCGLLPEGQQLASAKLMFFFGNVLIAVLYLKSSE
jgi:hypothetical protein